MWLFPCQSADEPLGEKVVLPLLGALSAATGLRIGVSATGKGK